MDTINERFRELRKSCHKTQEEFGAVFGLSRSAINAIENGAREILDRHLLMLQNWKEYKVNIDWLRTGRGEIFLIDESDALEVLRDAYNLSDLQFDVVAAFVHMPPDDRELMLEFIRDVAERQKEREAAEAKAREESEKDRIEREAAEEVEEYRKQLIREKTAALSASQDASESEKRA